MALEAGDARKGTGLAGAIADKMRKLEPTYNPNKNKGWIMPDAIAQAIVEYITQNAEVVGVETEVTVESGIEVVSNFIGAQDPSAVDGETTTDGTGAGTQSANGSII